MINSIKSKNYWIKILPALVWQTLYLVVSNLFDPNTRVYCDLAFYLGIAVYFYVWREWRFSQWGHFIKKGKAFWLPVLFTALGMAAMYGVSIGVAMLLPNANDGMGVFRINSWATLLAFAMVTMVLPPLAEEAFYRKAITAFDTKSILLITAAASVVLYASEHSLMPLGFFQACLWGIPLSIAYIKTKNIYICMTAHFLCNFVVNGMTVAASAMQLAK